MSLFYNSPNKVEAREHLLNVFYEKNEENRWGYNHDNIITLCPTTKDILFQLPRKCPFLCLDVDMESLRELGCRALPSTLEELILVLVAKADKCINETMQERCDLARKQTIILDDAVFLYNVNLPEVSTCDTKSKWRKQLTVILFCSDTISELQYSLQSGFKLLKFKHSTEFLTLKSSHYKYTNISTLLFRTIPIYFRDEEVELFKNAHSKYCKQLDSV
eukprot:snap_masked-scaffold_3-processed-gene-8.31-mRNA-1 protein AED:1.00 eAED:1.00 QI:0/0/0/0/1/1/2/0/218